MPNAAPRPCRDRLCPEVAVSHRGWCQAHDPGAWEGAHTPMPRGWAKVRAAVLQRDGGRCQLCGAPASEVDHLVPRAAGGTDDPVNLRALCRPCHSRRSARQGGLARRAVLDQREPRN